MKRRNIIVDEDGLVCSTEQVAQILGVSQNTVRNLACQWHKQNPDETAVPLEALRTETPKLVSILVIDDRLNAHSEPFMLPVVRLAELCGLPRATMYHRYHAFGRIWDSHPLPLKAFLKFTLTYRPKRGRHYKGALIARNQYD